MITADELARRLGLKDKTLLSRWGKQGIIPRPTLGLNPITQKGRVALYPESVLPTCLKVKTWLDEGKKYSRIRELLQFGTLQHEYPEPIEGAKPSLETMNEQAYRTGVPGEVITPAQWALRLFIEYHQGRFGSNTLVPT